MKNGLALIYKIWSDLKEKESHRRFVNVEGVSGGMETKLE
jgi:hypothetical protein